MSAPDPHFSTRNAAVADVVAAIESTGEVTDARADYDVDAICDEVIGDHADGYAPRVDVRGFWEAVARHRRTRHVATVALDSVESIDIDVDTIDGEKLVCLVDSNRTTAVTPSVALRLGRTLIDAGLMALDVV